MTGTRASLNGWRCPLGNVLQRSAASALALSLALAPVAPAGAAPGKSGKRKGTQADSADPLAKVSDDIRKGQERFDIADYEGAVEHWSKAYVGLPDGEDAAAFRTTLAYQISTACRKAYEVGHDIEYLHKAEHLLEQYRESLGPEDEEARASADEVLGELRTEIEQEENARKAERAKSEEGLSELRDEIRAEEERKAREAEREAEEERAARERDDRARANQRGQQLQISGGVALGVGAVCLGVMGFALARGGGLDQQGQEELAMSMDVNSPTLEDIRDQGVTMNRLSIGMGVTGGVLAVTGAALLAIGSLQRTRATAVVPALGPGYAGVGLIRRF